MDAKVGHEFGEVEPDRGYIEQEIGKVEFIGEDIELDNGDCGHDFGKVELNGGYVEQEIGKVEPSEG